MKRVFTFSALLLAGNIVAQNVAVAPAPAPTKDQIVRFQPSHEQRWIEDALLNTRVTLFESDAKDRFNRETYAYTEVRFASACQFTYTEHRYIAANDRLEHDFDPVSLDLRDLAPGKAKLTRWSEGHPAQAPLRYSLDGWTVQLASTSGKTVRPIVFEGKQTAQRFIQRLDETARACGPAAAATK